MGFGTVPLAPLLKPFRDVSPTTDVGFIDLTDLDINEHKAYLLLFSIRNPSPDSPEGYWIWVEGDYVIENYYTKLIVSDGSDLRPWEEYGSCLEGTGPGDRTCGAAYLWRDPDGYFRLRSVSQEFTGEDLRILTLAVCKKEPVSNITSIRISSAIGDSGIGAGSRFMLFRLGG